MNYLLATCEWSGGCERKRRNIVSRAFSTGGSWGDVKQGIFSRARDLAALAWEIIFSLRIFFPTHTDRNTHGIFVEVWNTVRETGIALGEVSREGGYSPRCILSNN